MSLSGVVGNMSMSQKLFSLVGVLITGLIALSGFVLVAIHGIERDIHLARDEQLPMFMNAIHLKDEYCRIGIIVEEAFLSDNPSEVSKLEHELTERYKKSESEVQEWLKLAPKDQQAEVERLRSLLQQKSDLDHQIFSALQNGKSGALAILHSPATQDLNTKVTEILNSSVELEKKAMSDELNHAYDQAELALFEVIGGSLLISLLSLALAIWIVYSLREGIRNVVSKVADSSNAISEASTELAAVSEELSSSSTEQAAAAQETSSAAVELSSITKSTSDNSAATAQSADESLRIVSDGRLMIESSLEAMNRIRQSTEEIEKGVAETNAELASISKVISEIQTKTVVINDIVFQTKLLSFNASVEAARAGESGKGFAVVAEEVGNLAQMSGTAAKEIEELLLQSTKKVSSVIESSSRRLQRLMSDTQTRVREGQKNIEDCSKVFNQIVEGSQKVQQLADQISISTNEGARGVAEISKAVGEIDQATQQNACASVEASKAAHQLALQCTHLQTAIIKLRCIVDGEKAHSMSAPPHQPAKPSGNGVKGKPLVIQPITKKYDHEGESLASRFRAHSKRLS